MEVRKTGCCGVMELVNISHCSTARDVVLQAAPGMVLACHEAFARGRRPYAYFTSVTKRLVNDHASRRLDDYGADLASYIRAHDLGTVDRAAAPQLNWTGNTLSMWVWTVDWDNLALWWNQQGQPTALPAIPVKRY